MAYDAATSTVVLFGGSGKMHPDLGDTWTWGGSTWTKQAPATSPHAREFASMAYALRG
jgi:galactose oxidase-like protein